MTFLTAEQVHRSMQPGESFAFLLRHAERRHITPQDTDHGTHVPLNDRGREQALTAGKELSIFQGSLFVGSSPVFRCCETAALIARSMGNPEFSDPENVAHLQPLAEFYVNDFDAYLHHLTEGFYPAICKWITDGRLAGFVPVKEGSETFLRYILEHSQADVSLFCTHDAWVVPFLSYFTDIRFTPSFWLNFLSGAAILYRPENPLQSAKIYPVKFIGDGFLRF